MAQSNSTRTSRSSRKHHTRKTRPSKVTSAASTRAEDVQSTPPAELPVAGLHNFAEWEPLREMVRHRIANGDLRAHFSLCSIPGVAVVEAVIPEIPCPVAWVWYRHECGKTLSILQSFVTEGLRRSGLRRALHQQMLASFPEIRLFVTERGTPQSAAFLQSVGFVFNGDLDRWELRIEVPTEGSKEPKEGSDAAPSS
jgi:hypothetical protein